jgi:hypothetical protein
MNAYSLIISFYVALLSTATSFANPHTISTQPVSFDVAEASREVMELITGETVVYDNARGARGSVLFIKEEIGDEVRIKTINELSKYISQIQFEYFASLNSFESGQNGILRIYTNDPIAEGEGSSETPGQLIFESDSFALKPGYQMVTLAGLEVMISPKTESITWSVNFSGLSAIGSAGLMINDAPNVGGSSGHCWVNKGTIENPSWILKEEASKTFNFSARISAKDVSPKIHINNDMVRPDKPFDVKFDFGTASSKDWIGIYKKDMIPGAEAPLAWMYLNNSANPPNHGLIGGAVTFDISELWAGHYNVYFFANDTFEDLDRLPFKVLDTIGPVITLQGQGNVRINVGEEYQDAGARASDNLDGDITKAIEANGAVDSSKPGVYTITYNVKDQAGNASYEAVRTVEVANPNPPVISIVRNINSEVIISFKGKLELATTIKGPWENVSEKSPLIINPNKEILFYRSVK